MQFNSATDRNEERHEQRGPGGGFCPDRARARIYVCAAFCDLPGRCFRVACYRHELCAPPDLNCGKSLTGCRLGSLGASTARAGSTAGTAARKPLHNPRV